MYKFSKEERECLDTIHQAICDFQLLLIRNHRDDSDLSALKLDFDDGIHILQKCDDIIFRHIKGEP